MSFCLVCEKGSFQEKKVVYTQTIGGHTFKTPLMASVCEHCHSALYPPKERERASWIIAVELASGNEIDRDAFRFLRDVLRLRVTELAPLLGVRPTTITRWEVGARAVNQRAAKHLAQIVLDTVKRRTRRETFHQFSDPQAA